MKWMNIQYGSVRISNREQVRISVTDNVELWVSKSKAKPNQWDRRRESVKPLSNGRCHTTDNRRNMMNTERKRLEQKRMMERREQEKKKKQQAQRNRNKRR